MPHRVALLAGAHQVVRPVPAAIGPPDQMFNGGHPAHDLTAFCKQPQSRCHTVALHVGDPHHAVAVIAPATLHPEQYAPLVWQAPRLQFCTIRRKPLNSHVTQIFPSVFSE